MIIKLHSLPGRMEQFVQTRTSTRNSYKCQIKCKNHLLIYQRTTEAQRGEDLRSREGKRLKTHIHFFPGRFVNTGRRQEAEHAGLVLAMARLAGEVSGES